MQSDNLGFHLNCDCRNCRLGRHGLDSRHARTEIFVTETQTCVRERQERVNRVRRRLSQIKPEDGDMIALVGAVKGLLDIVADDGDDFE
jgi:hypothetical protein